MKARIKKTGEIINIAEHAMIELEIYNSSGNPVRVYPDDIELIQESSNNIDWQQRRYEIAKAAMQGILSNEEQVNFARREVIYGDRPHTLPIACAQYAVACADALIEELKNN